MERVSFIVVFTLLLSKASYCLSCEEDSCTAPTTDAILDVQKQVQLLSDQMDKLRTAVQRLEETCGSDTNTSQETDIYQNCAEIQEAGNTENGVYTIYPRPGSPEVSVYCDLMTEGGGWTVFQRRMNGSINFFRGYLPYRRGFGKPASEYWLGLNNIRALVEQEGQELRVDLEDFTGETAYAKYSAFSIGEAGEGFQLYVTGYSGTAGDSLTHHSGARFITKDTDNADQCANLYKGAWWYQPACHYSNLNGYYFLGGHHSSHADGVNWYHWKGYNYSLKKTEMKIRPTGFIAS